MAVKKGTVMACFGASWSDSVSQVFSLKWTSQVSFQFPSSWESQSALRFPSPCLNGCGCCLWVVMCTKYLLGKGTSQASSKFSCGSKTFFLLCVFPALTLRTKDDTFWGLLLHFSTSYLVDKKVVWSLLFWGFFQYFLPMTHLVRNMVKYYCRNFCGCLHLNDYHRGKVGA